MARDLRVHAHVVERARSNRGDDRARVGAVIRIRAVIATLAGRDCSDNQPYQQDEPSDSHFYLRKTGSSCISEELRARDVLTSTPRAADTRGRGVRCPADWAFRVISHILAVSEVAANTVKHAKSPGSLKIWHDAREIVCQIHDEGVITDPLAGRRQPSLDAVGGHGLWIVNQVCDQVEMQSDETGTTIRLHMNLPRRGAGQ